MKARIGRTRLILPFMDLSPQDFERLAFWVVTEQGFEQVEHTGAGGADGGRDITAYRNGEQWVFQAKRVQSFQYSLARPEIERLSQLLPNERPQHYVFITSALISVALRNRISASMPEGTQVGFWARTELDRLVKRSPESIVDEFFHDARVRRMWRWAVGCAVVSVVVAVTIFVVKGALRKQKEEIEKGIVELNSSAELIAEFPGLRPPTRDRQSRIEGWMRRVDRTLADDESETAWSRHQEVAPSSTKRVRLPEEERRRESWERDEKKWSILERTTRSPEMRAFATRYLRRLRRWIEAYDFLSRHRYVDDVRDAELVAVCAARMSRAELLELRELAVDLLAFSKHTRFHTIESKDARKAWSDVNDFLRSDSSPYEGLKLSPLEGLRPIGADPRSGLLEFLHWWSHDGSYELTGDESAARSSGRGIVLVLIPGDPVIEVRPFLISKYEVTQYQWLRMTNHVTSSYPAGSPIGRPGDIIAMPTGDWPAHGVSADDCSSMLPWGSLRLPTMAEWDYVRGESVERSNHRDLSYSDASGQEVESEERDGHVLFAPVGSFPANAFGLHDVDGNASEYVQGVDVDGFARLVGGSYESSKEGLRMIDRVPSRTRVPTAGIRPAMTTW